MAVGLWTFDVARVTSMMILQATHAQPHPRPRTAFHGASPACSPPAWVQEALQRRSWHQNISRKTNFARLMGRVPGEKHPPLLVAYRVRLLRMVQARYGGSILVEQLPQGY